MKKVILLFVFLAIISILFFFWPKSSHAWTAKTIEVIEGKDLFYLEIKDPEIEFLRIKIILKVPPEFKKEVLEFLEVNKPEEIIFVDRDMIKKPAPPLIREIDKTIEKIKNQIKQKSFA